MPINFPDSPTDGQIFTVGQRQWVYQLSTQTWKAYADSSVFLSTLTGGTVTGSVTVDAGSSTSNAVVVQGTAATGGMLSLTADTNYQSRWLRTGTQELTSAGGYWDTAFRRSSGTVSAPTDITGTPLLGEIRADGYLNVSYRPSSKIEFNVDQSPSGSFVPGRISFFTTPAATAIQERVRIDSLGRVQIFGSAVSGAARADDPILVALGSGTAAANTTVTFTAGSNVLDVTAVSSGTLAVGQYIQTSTPETNIPPGTYIESFGTGTGGTGTYNLSASSQASGSGLVATAYGPDSTPILRLRNTDSTQAQGQPVGGIEFYGSDATTNSDHVRAGVFAISESTSGQTGLQFMTSAFQGSPQVRMRLDGNGLLSGRGTSLGPWTSYAPTLTGWTQGNGTINAAYCQVGKFVHFRIELSFGSTTTIAGNLGFGLPISADTTIHQRANQSSVSLRDLDQDRVYLGVGEYISSTTINVYSIGTNGLRTAMTSTVPFTWFSGDNVLVSGTYQAA